MLSSTRRLVSSLVLVGAVVACLVAPLAAGAATTRYASPGGTGASPCIKAAPCSIETALSTAGPEGLTEYDRVLLAPGTYEPTGELKVDRYFVTVGGEPERPAPVIEAAPGERGLFLPDTTTVRDLHIHSTAATRYALLAIGAESLLERIESTGAAIAACGFGTVVARDSVCATSNPNGEGVVSSDSGEPGTGLEPMLSNLTAIGGRVGINAVANEYSTVKITAVNTVVRGGQADVAALSQEPPNSHVEVLLSHSNFSDAEATVDSIVTSPTANGNQSAPPVFVDEAGGDYREAATSPTRLAGDLASVLPGETDLAGNPRTTNCAGTIGVDIGAYQYECPPVVGNSTVTVIKPPPPPQTPPAVSPSLTKLALKPANFTTTGKAPKGTTVSFTLSAAASVELDVMTKKTAKGKPPKTVTIGSLPVVKGKAGANSVRFAGRLGGKPLDPGKYSLRAVASAAGLSSRPVTRSFTVLIP